MVEVDGLELRPRVTKAGVPVLAGKDYWLNQTSCFEAAVWESADNVRCNLAGGTI